MTSTMARRTFIDVADIIMQCNLIIVHIYVDNAVQYRGFSPAIIYKIYWSGFKLIHFFCHSGNSTESLLCIILLNSIC